MVKCDVCGRETGLPFKCTYCGGAFCPEHRLPENHSCERFAEVKPRERRQIPKDVISRRGPEEVHLPVEIHYEVRSSGFPKSPSFRHFFFRRASGVLLLAIFAVFIGQLIAQVVLGPAYHAPGDHGTFLYYLAPSRATALTRPWTIMTSIFLHVSFLHLLVNGIVLFFLGPILEMRIGRRRFTCVFLGAGISAGVAQLLVIPSDIVILGASGAILGVLGTLTILAPRLSILLFFFVPMPLWMVTLGFGVLSVILTFLAPGGSIAHMAHLTGIVIGLIYGYKLKREEGRRRQYFFRKISDRGPWF